MIDFPELTVHDLLLDKENPRHGLVENQSDALEYLIERNPSHFRKMMLSIKENGLDPGDSFYVVNAEKKGYYIVLEGNRRLSALKVLFDPNVLKDINLVKADPEMLRRAALGFDADGFPKIRCVCFESRDEAREWIKNRHAGSRDGIGRITWGPTEKQRFTKDGSVLDVLNFVESRAEFKPGEWEPVRADIEGEKSSTLGRLLESSAAYRHIGISIKKDSDGHKTPMLNRDPKWTAFALKKMIFDVRNGKVNSRSLNDKSDINSYFEDLTDNLPSSGKETTPEAVKNFITGNPKTLAKKSTTQTSTTSRVPRLRKMLAPKNNFFKTPKSPKGERLLIEAAALNVEKFTISSAFVLRAFIELAVNEYMTKRKFPKTRKSTGGKRYDIKLAEKAKLVMEDIIEKDLVADTDMNPFRKNILNPTSPTSIQSLNGFMHGKYDIPTSEALLVGWDSCVPVFEAAFGKV